MNDDDSATFVAHRPALLALAYRMLGDMARAEDMVQDAWVRWQGRAADVRAPKAFLLSTVTRLCLDELGSAHARRELSRGDRLPEPVDLGDSGFGRVDMLDQISMAFLVMLQRLTPAERAIFLLHEVFELSHAEIAPLVERSEAACRQLSSRARENLAVERRALHTSRDEHARLFAGVHPRHHQRRARGARRRDREPGRLVGHRAAPAPAQRRAGGGRVQVAIFVAVADGQIRGVFLQADSERLRYVGAPS